MCAHRRYADTSRGEHFFGRSDRIPERSGGDEPFELQAGDEHFLRPAAHRQHLRRLRQVMCTPGSLGSGLRRIGGRSEHSGKTADVMLFFFYSLEEKDVKVVRQKNPQSSFRVASEEHREWTSHSLGRSAVFTSCTDLHPVFPEDV